MLTPSLSISPQYAVTHWKALQRTNEADWPKAVAIIRDRIEGRFLRYADQVIKDVHSGFIVLAIDCLVAETIQQFKEGLRHSQKKSCKVFGRFLEGPRFQPHFDRPEIRCAFYRDIRCGLLHQAEAKNQWRVRRDHPNMLTTIGTGYVINAVLFHEAIQASLDDYLAQILLPKNDDLRAKLWNKMRFICDVRIARVEEENATAVDQPT